MKDIVKLFTDEKVTEISPLGKGHINGTFCVCLENSTGKKRRVVLQKINSYVFKDIDRLMKNICRVTDHLKTKLTPFENPDRAVMTVLPSLKGNSYEKINGEYYRCLSMIEDTITYDKIENCNDMYRCAAAFADFHKKLADFPAGTLRETIPDFHNTEARYTNFIQAVKEDRVGRAKDVAAEIENCIKRKSLASEIVSKLNNDTLPLRVIHNDTKLNNILFDRRTNTPLCVVDLDTVMPGAVCYDFGDSVRSAASVTGDGQDLSIVHLDMDLFEACAAGYINSAKEFLTDAEAESFIIAPMVITYENALRFLTDYLDGDIYFRIRHPLQNLLRCRAHLKLVDDMEKKLPEMERIIKKHMNNK